jgi:hypothetical protein
MVSTEQRSAGGNCAAAAAASGRSPSSAGGNQAFLSRLPRPFAGHLSDLFHDAVRAGRGTPSEVVQWVVADVLRRLERQTRPDAAEAQRALLGAMAADPEGARAYAAHCLHWRALPQSERQKLKQDQRDAHRAAMMESLPATEKQIGFLRVLGYSGPPPPSRAEASRLIDERKQQREAGTPA